MNTSDISPITPLFTVRSVHPWLRKLRLAYVPGPSTPLLDEFSTGLLQCFREKGHTVLSQPENPTDVLLTTAPLGKPLNWRHALLFTARKLYKLETPPTVITLLQATPGQLQERLAYFERVLSKDPPDPADFAFQGLAPQAYHTLYEQGRRGGPILSWLRLLQSQAKCIRIILIVGEDHPLKAYTFDLVGAYPCTLASDPQDFYTDLVLRIATAASTQEVTDHEVIGDPISYETWKKLQTPSAMRLAGRELGKRHFFTEMVRIDNLVNVPAVQASVSSQYSEGCFATWEPMLGALVTTITGSARPVEKDNLTDDELALITGVRSDGKGALVRHVEGKRNDPPSSEAVELIQMDGRLPRLALSPEWNLETGATSLQVPIARSKLHGHRGIKSYDPRQVEHVYLEPAYYFYPVSCATQAQAQGIQAAFARSIALTNPEDPRQVVFTVLPGHGCVIVEKWVPGKAPFQVIWEAIDAGWLEIDNHVPQGPLEFVQDTGGRSVLVEG